VVVVEGQVEGPQPQGFALGSPEFVQTVPGAQGRNPTFKGSLQSR